MESSSLGNIPGELRNRIWRNVLISPKGWIDVTGKDTPDEPGLLAVCTQIRAESIAIYYAENSFRIRSQSENRLLLWRELRGGSWLRSIGTERAKMLKKLLLGPTKDNTDSIRLSDTDTEGALHWIRAPGRRGRMYTEEADCIAKALSTSGIRLSVAEVALDGLVGYSAAS